MQEMLILRSRVLGLALIRITVGVLLIYHGWEVFDPEKIKTYAGWFVERNYPNPTVWPYLGKTAELLAGIGLTLGLFTRLFCYVTILTFAGIIFMLGDKGKVFQGDQHPFLFILLALTILFTRPGVLSVDNLIFKKGR